MRDVEAEDRNLTFRLQSRLGRCREAQAVRSSCWLPRQQEWQGEARRNRLLGLWAAGKLGKSGDAANAYAKEVVAAEFEEGGDAAVVRKILGDLGAKGVAVTEAEIRARMSDFLTEAVAQVKAGK